MTFEPGSSSSTRRPHSAQLGVGVIGTGKVGVVLAAALGSAGHPIVAVTARSDESRDRVEAMLPGAHVTSAEQVASRCELVIVAVPDDVLPGVITELAEAETWQSGQLVLHTSGRFGLGVLDPATEQGAIGLAVHPAMTFTGTSADLVRLQDCRFGVTTLPMFSPIAQALVIEIGGEPVVIDDDARVLYHTALAHGANHLVTLVSQAAQILRVAGVEEPGPVLGPLLHAALANALDRGDAALTGPVARGDISTVKAHVEQLRNPSVGADDVVLTSDVIAAYAALANATVARAERSGQLTQDNAASIRDALT